MAGLWNHSLQWVLAFFSFCIISISAELQRFEHPIKANGSLSLLVIGDWGRRGHYNQSLVADQMGRIGEKLNIDLVVSTGDNFYENGLTRIHDPSFKKSFAKIYTAKSLQKQWYSGNHDYRGNVEAQLNPNLRKIDCRWLCLRSFVLSSGIVDFFFVDTTPFVDKYFLRPGHHTYDWRGVLPRNEYLANLLVDLDLALTASTANWKIVIGHHPIRSIGHHRDTAELIVQLLPILEVHDVDMYINGHDHCLEHISSTRRKIQFLTSGGGSKAWNGDIDQLNQDGLKFYYDGQGFMSAELTQTEARIVFYDIFGKVLHNLDLTKELYSTM